MAWIKRIIGFIQYRSELSVINVRLTIRLCVPYLKLPHKPPPTPHPFTSLELNPRHRLCNVSILKPEEGLNKARYYVVGFIKRKFPYAQSVSQKKKMIGKSKKWEIISLL